MATGTRVPFSVGQVWRESKQKLSLNNPQDQNSSIYKSTLAWRTVTSYFHPATYCKIQLGTPVPPTVQEALVRLWQCKRQDALFHWYLENTKISFTLVKESVDELLEQYERAAGEDQPPIVAQLLHTIGTWYEVWQRPLPYLTPEKDLHLHWQRKFLLCLFISLSSPIFSQALTTLLRHLLHSPLPPSQDPSFLPLTLSTLILLLERYDPLLFSLIYIEIEKYVKNTCTGVFDRQVLKDIMEWLNGGVMEWVAGIYAGSMMGKGKEKEKEGGSSDGLEEAKKMLKPTFARFEYHVHKTLCALRTTELFDIIVDFPESKPALEDLKICLIKTDQRSLLVNRLKNSNARRLLHPGADTKDIISHYISTIRCLRILDSQGVLLSRVAEPVRKYLRSREDTIRCIVSSLIEDGNELTKELAASDARPVHDSRDDAENYSDPKWAPEPIDAPADFRRDRGSDIIQLLVSIYDSKDVFVRELQVLLAQRLLAITDYELDKEIKNLEILKIRFGEASLQGCDVMIKDLVDSKRIDYRVHTEGNGEEDKNLHATIVSRLFWPSFQNQGLKLPGQLGRAQKTYEQTYVRFTPDKKLRWVPQLGTINLTVELKDHSYTLDVTILQAAILELFDKQDTWTLEDLAAELRITDTASVKNGLFFWNNQGVVKNIEGDLWRLLENKDMSVDAAAAHVLEDEAPAVQSVESEQIAQMRVFQQFVVGMLTNLRAMPLTRIHAMLGTLVPDYRGRTTDELTALLEAMAEEGVVEKAGTMWKIV